MEVQIQTLLRQLKAQKQRNRNLETYFLKQKYEIFRLKNEISKLKVESKYVDNILNGIFTDNQIRKIKNGDIKQDFTEADMANSIVLHSENEKIYRFLQKKKFPLPKIHTLYLWSQKIVKEMSPGLLQPFFNILAEVRRLTKKQKVCVLSFEKMKMREVYCYDKVSDSTLSPAKNVLVGTLKGLTSKWNQPVFYDFDCNITTDIITTIMKTSENIGYNVVAIVCDLEESNGGLLEDLQVDHEKPWFVHEGKKIYVFSDVIYLIKSLRNLFLDVGFVIDGKSVQKDIFENIPATSCLMLQQCLENTGTERHKAKMATRLFSRSVAKCLSIVARRHLLDEKNWQQCVKLLETTNDWLDVMNVRALKRFDSDKRTTPYDGYDGYEKDKRLDNMTKMVTEMRAIGKTSLLPFQKGILQTNMAFKLLLVDMDARFQINSVQTSQLNHGILENFIGEIHSKEGIYDHPDRLQFEDRFQHHLFGLLHDYFHTEVGVDDNLVKKWNDPLSTKIRSRVSGYRYKFKTIKEDIVEINENDDIENIAGYIYHKLKGDIPDKNVKLNTSASSSRIGKVSEIDLSELVKIITQLENIFISFNKISLNICTGYLKELTENLVLLTATRK